MNPRILRAIVVAAAAGIGTAPTGAQAEYPSRPVSMIVGYAPGGSTDLTARLIAPELAKRLGQPVVIDNVAGSGGTIGAARAAKAKPDGHTLYLCTYNEIVGAPAIRKQMLYDADKDFTLIGMVGTQAGLLLASHKTGVTNTEQFLAALRRQPGRLNYGSPGVGSALQLSVELLKSNAGVFLVHIPYRGVPQMVNDMLGDNLEFGIFALASGLPYVRSGKLVAIGTTEKQRTAATPDIPALAENAALKEVDLASWFALCGPAGLPATVQDKLRRVLDETLALPDVRARLTESGTTVRAGIDLAAFVRADVERTRKIVRFANIQDE